MDEITKKLQKFVETRKSSIVVTKQGSDKKHSGYSYSSSDYYSSSSEES
jgi:hypothetical protein